MKIRLTHINPETSEYEVKVNSSYPLKIREDLQQHTSGYVYNPQIYYASGAIIDLLAQYENTGLTPEKIERLKNTKTADGPEETFAAQLPQLIDTIVAELPSAIEKIIQEQEEKAPETERRGEWKNNAQLTMNLRTWILTCSECGENIQETALNSKKFCPNCGAKMEE